MRSPVAETRYHTCMLCEAACGIAVDLEGGRVARVRGDRDDPFSRGHICPKAAAIPDVMEDPDRVREPLRRSEAGFAPVSSTTSPTTGASMPCAAPLTSPWA